MNTEATLQIVQLVNNLFQLAQAVNLSATDLVANKEKAAKEGRTWGQEDVDGLIAKSRASVNTLGDKLNG